jgi:ACS family glucarate transporter-like MFS transporter
MGQPQKVIFNTEQSKTVTKPSIVLLVLFLGYTLVYTDKFVIGLALVPIGQELGLDPAKTGLVLSAFFLGYSLFQIPAGWLNDRIGSKKVLMLSMSILGLCALLFGFTWSLMTLILVRFMAGVGHAGYPSACSKTVATTFPVEKRTFAQSILLASSGVGMVVGPLVAAPLINEIGWRYMFAGLAVIALGVVLLMKIIIPTAPKAKQGIQEQKSTTKLSFVEILKNPIVIVLFSVLFCINVVLYGLTSWLPSFLVNERGLDLILAGKVTAISGVGMGIASIFTGWFVGKYMAGKEKGVILFASILGAVFLYLVYAVDSLYLSTGFLCIASMFLMIVFVTAFTLPLKLLPQNVIGSTIGIVNTGSTLGGAVSPLVIGNLVSSSGGTYKTTFLFLVIVTILTGVIILFLKNKRIEQVDM